MNPQMQWLNCILPKGPAGQPARLMEQRAASPRPTGAVCLQYPIQCSTAGTCLHPHVPRRALGGVPGLRGGVCGRGRATRHVGLPGQQGKCAIYQWALPCVVQATIAEESPS